MRASPGESSCPNGRGLAAVNLNYNHLQIFWVDVDRQLRAS